jgi:hypothetical protein
MRVSRRVVLQILPVLLWLLPPGAAVLLWLAALWMPDPTIMLTIGSEAELNDYAEARHLYSFLGWEPPEAAADRLVRRATPQARFVVPWALRLGDPLRVTMVAGGWGVEGPVQLRANNDVMAFPVSGGWRSYNLLLPYEPSLYGRDLYLEWQSSGMRGPLLDSVELRAAHPDGWLAGPPILALALALVLWLGRRQSLRARMGWLVLLAGCALAARLLYAPQLLPFAALLALGGAAAVVLTLLVPALSHRFALWALVLWLLAVPQLLGTWVLDDAFISFRYARNLVEGHGLNFNPGGELVEGYTNFLWTMLMAGVLALGLEPVLYAQVLTSGLALATLIVVYKLAEAWWPGYPSLALLAPLLLALNPSFLLYTVRGSGMETALVTLLALAALWLIWRAETLQGGLLAGVGCALLVLARPDGALVPLAGGLWLGMLALRQGWRSPPALALAGLVFGFVILYGPYFVWRYSYYGYLLPNTFYAKTGATLAQVQRGLVYTQDFFATPGLYGLLVLLGLSLSGLFWRRHANEPSTGIASPAPLLWLFLLLTVAYVVAVGGDHFPLGRFFVPILPPLMLLLSYGALTAWELHSHLPRAVGPAAAAVAVLALLVILAGGVWQLPASDSRAAEQPVWREHKVTMKNIDVGHWLRRNTPPDTVVSTGIAGALPYYAERRVIDMLGLNDVYIAHLEVDTMGQGIAGAEKIDVGYVLDQQPDYIPFSSAGAFLDNERFRRSYELVEVRGPLGGDILLYQRRGE